MRKKLFVISRDPRPEPWEDYSSPYCIVRGQAGDAEKIKKELNARYPESLFFISEVADSEIKEVES